MVPILLVVCWLVWPVCGIVIHWCGCLMWDCLLFMVWFVVVGGFWYFWWYCCGLVLSGSRWFSVCCLFIGSIAGY